jgi:hypothetical protein
MKIQWNDMKRREEEWKGERANLSSLLFISFH